MGASCSNCSCRTISTTFSQPSEDVSSEKPQPMPPVMPKPRIWKMPSKQHKLRHPVQHPIGQEDELEFQFMECEFTFYFKTATFYKQQSAEHQKILKLDQNYLVDCDEDLPVQNSNIESDSQQKMVTQTLKNSVDCPTANRDNSPKPLTRRKSNESNYKKLDKEIQSLKQALDLSGESQTPKKSILKNKESKYNRAQSLYKVQNDSMTNKSINTSKSKKKVQFDQKSLKNSKRNFNFI